MRAAVRFIILIPLGLLFGVCAATLTLFVLGANVQEFGEAFVAAFIAAWRALWDSLALDNDPDAALRTGARIWTLAILTLAAPVALSAIIAEIARLRGALPHMVLTGALTILLPFAAGAPTRALTAAETRVLACLFFTGAAAGLVYWAIAGLPREAEPPRAAPAA